MERENTVFLKVTWILPIPFNMLVRVVHRYKKGHKRERFRRKVPESSLEKKNIPKSVPNKRKVAVQNKPISRLYLIEFSVALLM